MAADAVVVNQFVVLDAPQLMTNSADQTAYLLLGHIAPPAVVDELEFARFLEVSGGTIHVKPQGAFVFTLSRLEELHRILGTHLATLKARRK